MDCAWQRQRRSPGGGPTRPCRCAARERRIYAAPYLAHCTRGKRLLRRVCQRRYVAAMPRGACTPRVPRVGLGLLLQGEPTVCRRSGGGGPRRGPGSACAGLPLRSAARDDSRQTSACNDHHLLAYPMAKPGVLRYLPMAAPDSGRHVGQHHPWFPYTFSLQKFSRDGRPIS